MKVYDIKSKVDHFKDIIGYDDIKCELERIIDIMNNKEKYEKLGATVPRNVLLHGKPGTGKTTIAKDFISAVNRKSYIIRRELSCEGFLNKVKDIFNEAEKNEPSIILLDDLDKFANFDVDKPNSEEYITIQSCIDDIKGKDIFVFATINNKRMLPSSLIRPGRFDRQLDVEMPTDEDGLEIMKYYLRDKKIDSSVDINVFARILSNVSGASIEAIINMAGVEAGFRDSKVITLEDIVIAKLKVENGIRLGIRHPEKKKWKIAYHEAGHCLLTSLLLPKNLIYTSILVGRSSGVTNFTTPKKIVCNLDYRKKELIIILGGRVATELVYGEDDVGVYGDMKSLFETTSILVENLCVKGIDKFKREDNSNELYVRQEQTQYELLNDAYEKAKKIIANNREFLDKIAKELFEKDVLLYTEIDEIKSTCKIVEPTLS